MRCTVILEQSSDCYSTCSNFDLGIVHVYWYSTLRNVKIDICAFHVHTPISYCFFETTEVNQAKFHSSSATRKGNKRAEIREKGDMSRFEKPFDLRNVRRTRCWTSSICPTRRECGRSSSVATAFLPDEVTLRFGEILKSNNGNQLALGGVVGFATGYTIKRIGQLVLLIVGVEVIAMQLMANHNWIVVNWHVISQHLSPHVEKRTHDRIIEAIKLKLPFTASFSAGYLAGLTCP